MAKRNNNDSGLSGGEKRDIPNWLKRLTPGAKKAEDLKQRSPREIKKMDRDK